MANPRLIVKTGNALVDRQNREFADAGATYTAEVVISGQPRAVIKSIPHMLGRAPTGWRVVRRQPASGVSGDVVEATTGKFTRDYADLQFPGNGRWTIELL